ncbi:MAG: hypothetical protein M3033_05810 [Acidobacteriota bacterium]|nr:hypothetical protein [Acidobacteriota bacterium]
MFRKNYFSFLIAAAMFLTGSLFVFAQSAPVRGKVELKKADGTTEPVAGAMVEVFRTDLKGKLPTGKTDKKGSFSFAGFPLGQTFALSISAPNIQPQVFPNVKGGNENINITVVPGDGKHLTEDEVRQTLASSANTGGVASSGSDAKTASGKPAPESAEAKKQREELEKKNAEITASNEKIKNSDEIIKKSVEEGKIAFEAKNYDLAVAKYDEGYKAAPDFVGSAPILLNNKAAALTARATALYNQNVKVTDTTEKVANKTKVRQDFADAMDAYNSSWLIIKNNTSTEVPAAKVAEIKLQGLRGAQSTMQYMVSTDAVDNQKTEIARTLTQEYISAETDAAKKLKAQNLLGDVFRVAGDSANAIIEYRKTLETAPADPDALAGLGLSLFNAGAATDPENIAQMQEGLNYMQRFTEVAPENHPLKASVKEVVDYLKTKQLAPQKTNKTAPKKKP